MEVITRIRVWENNNFSKFGASGEESRGDLGGNKGGHTVVCSKAHT